MAVEARTSGRIFISYRREETAYPAGWSDRLTERFGRGSGFKDVDSIAFGDDFAATIATAVSSCDVLLALIGPRWVTMTDQHGRRRLDRAGDFVHREIETALTRNVRVIPILVDGARMPRVDELPPTLAPLARRKVLDINPSRFQSDTAALITVLERTLHEQQSSRGAPESSAPAPRSRRRIALGAGAAAVLVTAGVILATSHSAAPRTEGPPTAGPATPATPATAAPATAAPSTDQRAVLVADDFSSDTTSWTVSVGPGSSGRTADGAYPVEVAPASGGNAAGVFPDGAARVFPLAPADVVMEVTTTRLSAETAMDSGVMCRANKDPGYGYFLILSQRFAEIAKSSADDPFQQLTRTPLPFDAGGPHRLQAACRDQDAGASVHLSLTVDGQPLADYVDRVHPLTEGCVGLWIGMDPAARGTGAVRFDDFMARS